MGSFVFRFAVLLGALPIVCVPTTARACATCGCTLSTDAATGHTAQPGWRFSADYTFIDQDELRHGNGSASPEDVIDHPSDPGADESEIEKNTTNRYLNLRASYRPDANWGVTMLLPLISRDHTTYGEHEAPFTPDLIAPDQVSGASVSGLGDASLLLSYQGFLPTHNFGVLAGIKLPTGRYGGESEDGDVVGDPVFFHSGPLAGEALDTSLQAGTGSTDVIVGAYYYQPVSQNFDAFVDARFQAAVSERLDTEGADFRPGDQATLSTGLRYEAHANWVPQLQLNVQHKSADQGELADRANSEGTAAYLSGGISASLRRNVQIYGFVQVPVYSDLGGYQLFPHWTANVGISVAL
ncbi:MAG: transporter [Rhodanobacteraceae bacterium]